MENPAGSRLWSHEEFRVLADLPGVNMRLLAVEKTWLAEERSVDHWTISLVGSRAPWQTVKTGTGTILVATEQLRAAVGFEEWTPDREDIAALKDAATDLKDSVWADERGPGPTGNADNLEDDMQDYQPGTPRSLPPTPFVAAAPAPASPVPSLLPAQSVVQHQHTTTNVSMQLSPTFRKQNTQGPHELGEAVHLLQLNTGQTTTS